MDGPLSAGPSPGPQPPPSRSLRGRWDRGHHWCVAGRSCPRLRPKWLVSGCACAVTPRDSTCVQCRSANTSRCQAGRCRCAHGLPASPPSPAGPQSREMPRAGADSTVRAWGGPCPATASSRQRRGRRGQRTARRRRGAPVWRPPAGPPPVGVPGMQAGRQVSPRLPAAAVLCGGRGLAAQRKSLLTLVFSS